MPVRRYNGPDAAKPDPVIILTAPPADLYDVLPAIIRMPPPAPEELLPTDTVILPVLALIDVPLRMTTSPDAPAAVLPLDNIIDPVPPVAVLPVASVILPLPTLVDAPVKILRAPVPTPLDVPLDIVT